MYESAELSKNAPKSFQDANKCSKSNLFFKVALTASETSGERDGHNLRLEFFLSVYYITLCGRNESFDMYDKALGDARSSFQ